MAIDISKTKIANMALSNCGGRSRVENIDTEESPEAKECKLWYDHARIETLEAFNWSFARKRIVLALSTEDAPTGWSYRYLYPNDCVALREIENPSGPDADAVPYHVEMNVDGNTKTILTNLSEAVAVYTFDQRTPALFSRLFIKTLSHLLASYIAMAMTGKTQIKADQYNLYLMDIRLAAAQNANEAVDPEPRDASWTLDR